MKMMEEYREFSAKTVSDCITDACTTYSVPSDRLDYEVITEGSAGFMGLGSKLAKIKARVKETVFEMPDKPFKSEKSIKAAEKAAEKAAKEAAKAAPKSEPAVNVVKDEPVAEVKKEVEKKPVKIIPEEIKVEMIKQANQFLSDVFASMKIEATIECKFTTDETLLVNFSGEEMGILIGKRGQTLDSLQYLTSLVVNKGTTDYVRVKVDTENYRERRKETLENLAKNIAFKVKRTRRPISLEPMNPYERRIIHSALQNDKYVTTHSEGEEPFRKVVVTLKR